MKQIIVILAILILSGVIHAEETAKEMLVKMSGQISDEYSSCAAYFEIASRVMEHENKVYEEKYQALKRDSLAYAIGMAEMSQSKSVAEKQVTESYRNSFNIMAAAKKSGREVFASLIKEKSIYCPRLMEDPTVAMEKM